MKIDTGSAVVLAAVLIFYLRLIILQRERVKRNRREAAAQVPKKKRSVPPTSTASYSILSKNWLDLVIAGAGALAIIFGVMLNGAVIPIAALQPYWWLPTALGIIAFSWAFKL